MEKIKLATSKGIQPSYKFASIVVVDKEYLIDGCNIWNFYWQCTDRNVAVVDPFERQIYNFKEYEIKTSTKNILFVAGEFSNGEIGIYLKDELSDGKL